MTLTFSFSNQYEENAVSVYVGTVDDATLVSIISVKMYPLIEEHYWFWTLQKLFHAATPDPFILLEWNMHKKRGHVGNLQRFTWTSLIICIKVKSLPVSSDCPSGDWSGNPGEMNGS